MLKVFLRQEAIDDLIKQLPTQGWAILGLDKLIINLCNYIFLSSQAQQNAIQHL